MKKILFVLLFPTLFFSCIPMEKVTSDEYLDIRIHNRLSQPMSAYLSFDVDDNKGFFNKRDSVFPDSIAQMYGIGFDEEIRDKAFSVLKDISSVLPQMTNILLLSCISDSVSYMIGTTQKRSVPS